MIYFLTSSPFIPGSPDLNPANSFLTNLKNALMETAPGKKSLHLLHVCSDPTDFAATDLYSEQMRWALEEAGLPFPTVSYLDDRNFEMAAELVHTADLIELAGGSVPLQNEYFHRAHLKEALADYQGVLIGISAGSLDSARIVYNVPESDEEADDTTRPRYYDGLALTETHIMPHYQADDFAFWKNSRLVSILKEESHTTPIYVLPDSSYVLGKNGHETLFGEAFLLKDGLMSQISLPEGTYVIS